MTRKDENGKEIKTEVPWKKVKQLRKYILLQTNFPS